MPAIALNVPASKPPPVDVGPPPLPLDVPLDDTPLWKQWARRCLTVPGVHLGLVLVWGLLPLWLLLAIGADLVLGRWRWPSVRAIALLAWYLLCEVIGLQGALWSFLWAMGDADRLQGASVALQRVWTVALWGGTRRIYDLSLQVEGAESLPPGRAFLLLLRHSSLPDVLLPALAFANPRRIPLRYVLKVEVCWSPCLDIVGHRLPNAFVVRGSGNPAREIQRMAWLQAGLQPGEGLVVYPEGTRFSEARRQRLLDRLEGADRDRVLRFTHVLPPRRGGPGTLLSAREPVRDVVVCAHTGTETAMTAEALLSGGLIGQTFRVRVWCFRGSEAFSDPLGWLDQRWLEVDRWVAENRDGVGINS